jgi:hypothetical protein
MMDTRLTATLRLVHQKAPEAGGRKVGMVVTAVKEIPRYDLIENSFQAVVMECVRLTAWN